MSIQDNQTRHWVENKSPMLSVMEIFRVYCGG